MNAFEQAAHAAIATRLAKGTRQHYGRALKRWLTFCADSDVDPKDPPSETAAAWRNQLTAQKYESSTVRDFLAVMSFIYRRLTAQRPPAAAWNPFDPHALAWPPVSAVGKTAEVAPGVAERLIAAATNAGALRDVALMQLLHATGARRMSILSLRRETLRTRGAHLTARVVTKGSGGADLAEIVIPADAATALRAWLAKAPKSPWVFPGRDPRKAMDLSMPNKILAKWATACGTEHVHPHRFRAAFITEGFDAGLSWRDIQASVHHSDARSTQRYDRGRRGGNVAEAIEKRRRGGNDGDSGG